MDNVSLSVVSGSQLRRFVHESELPVLVEFGVDFNCPRCQQVKSDVVALSERLDQRVEVVRVDFNANASLVARLGGTICPTYVLFQNGEPVLTRSFPISMDLLEGEVKRLTVGQTFSLSTDARMNNRRNGEDPSASSVNHQPQD
jgi:hypothetical protein